MQIHWKRFINKYQPRGEQGQDLSEYALLIGFISIFVLVAVSLLGFNISALFEHLAGIIGSISI